MEKYNNMTDTIILIMQIVSPAIISVLGVIWSTLHSIKKKKPIDKIERVYDEVYYPIINLMKSQNMSRKNVELYNFVLYCEYILGKNKKLVDKSTLELFYRLKEADRIKYKVAQRYKDFDRHISKFDKSLRKQIGYLEPSYLNLYKLLHSAKKLLCCALFSLSGAYFLTILSPTLSLQINEDMIYKLAFFLIMITFFFVILAGIVGLYSSVDYKFAMFRKKQFTNLKRFFGIG